MSSSKRKTSQNAKSGGLSEADIITLFESVPPEFRPDVEELHNKLKKAPAMPVELHRKAMKLLSRLARGARFGNFSKDFEQMEKYIDWITKIPWGVYTQDNLDLANAKAIMDKSHYGMNKVKDLILEYLSVMKMRFDRVREGVSSDSYRSPVVLFVGLQGVGKTSIAKSIAKAMGRKIIRIALGGMSDISLLRGHPRSNPTAEPGLLVKALIRSHAMNPIIILDEIEKVSDSGGRRDDMMATLLEILDPEQNSAFLDYYLDFPIDLSKCMFICTANNLGTLSAALLDRLEIVRFVSYSDEEKEVIAKSYLFPKVVKASGLKENQVVVQDGVWKQIIRPLGYDSGIRQLERTLTGVCRKVAKKIITEGLTHVTITPENVKGFLPQDLGILS